MKKRVSEMILYIAFYALFNFGLGGHSAFARDLSQVASSYSTSAMMIAQNAVLGGFAVSALLLLAPKTRHLGLDMLGMAALGTFVVYCAPWIVSSIHGVTG